jgi:uncharacterized protein (TIGR02646 family)
MRTIEKGDEPASLRRYRADHRRSGALATLSSERVWAGYVEKDDTREALLDEQGHLCAFCMRRILLRRMKIAHWAPRSSEEGTHVILAWDNLLGACQGGDGGPREQQHCDTAQGDTPLKTNPADRAQRCERLLRYLPDGTITSDDEGLRCDIETLRLNYAPLRSLRKQVIDRLFSHLAAEGGGTAYWPRAMLERELARWTKRDHRRMLPELCQVATYFLERWLARHKA